jgi:hypothetical protein
MSDIGEWLLCSTAIALGIRLIVAVVERRQEQPEPAPTVIKATRKKRKTSGPTGAPVSAGQLNCAPVPGYSAAQTSSSEIRL